MKNSIQRSEVSVQSATGGRRSTDTVMCRGFCRLRFPHFDLRNCFGFRDSRFGLVRRSSLFSVGGFTLIELLVVIAIIAILAGLLFPAIKGAMLKAKISQAKTDCNSIANAIRQYQTEYGKWPIPDSDEGVSGDTAYSEATTTKQYEIINVLRAIASGINANNALNPRRIVFLEPSSRKGAIDSSGYYVDPWSTTASIRVYTIKCDNDFNNIVNMNSGDRTNITITVKSKGPDGVAGTLATNDGDDILNFK